MLFRKIKKIIALQKWYTRCHRDIYQEEGFCGGMWNMLDGIEELCKYCPYFEESDTVNIKS